MAITFATLGSGAGLCDAPRGKTEIGHADWTDRLLIKPSDGGQAGASRNEETNHSRGTPFAGEAASQKWGHSSFRKGQLDDNVLVAPETCRKSLSQKFRVGAVLAGPDRTGHISMQQFEPALPTRVRTRPDVHYMAARFTYDYGLDTMELLEQCVNDHVKAGRMSPPPESMVPLLSAPQFGR